MPNDTRVLYRQQHGTGNEGFAWCLESYGVPHLNQHGLEVRLALPLP